MLRSSRTFAVGCILATVLAYAVCAQEPSEPSDQTISLPVRPKGKYEFLTRPYATEEEARLREQLPYEAIELYQWGQANLMTLAPGTEYGIKLSRNGEASYEGVSGVRRIGKHTGAISLWDYGKLCLLLERFGVGESKCNLGIQVQVTHRIVADLTVYVAGREEPCEFRNDTSFGDFRFWLIQSAIERVVSEIEWEPTDGK